MDEQPNPSNANTNSAAINAQYSQGANINSSGTVNQTFNVTHIIQQAREYKFETLHELRPIRETFTGRTHEIAQLLDTARSATAGTAANAMTICSSVTGMGGVGKSELANVAAHALHADFPDLQLWLELGAHSVSPSTPEQTLQRVLQTVYPEAKLPDDAQALRGLYLQLLSGKRALVVIDDVLDDDDLPFLLPPAGCLALITSRKALARGVPLRLSVLPRPEAMTLLRRFRPELTDPDANALAALCGDLPVALNVAGSYLKQHTSIGAARYIAAVRKTPFDALKFGADEKNDVGRVFAHSAAQLSAAQRAAWCALSVMPADFDRAAGAAVSGVPDAALSHPLDALVALNLLEYSPQTERFGWHDLLQQFAARLVEGPAAGDEARGRHVVYYTGVAAQTDELYLKGQPVTGLSLFDREYKHIEAVFTTLARWAADGRGEGVQRALVGLVDAVVYTSYLRFHPHQRIVWLQAQAGAARAIGDKGYEGNALGNLGLAYADLGEVSKASGYYEQRLVIAREIGDRRGEGADLGNLGSAYYRLGEVSKAIGYYEQQLFIAREIGNRQGEGNALGGLGIAYAALGEVSQAIGFYEQNLVITREIGDRQGEANASWNLGLRYEAQGEWERAIELMQVRVAYLRELGHPDADKAAAGVAQVRAKLG